MNVVGPDVSLPLAQLAGNGVATLRRYADAAAVDALRGEIEAFCEAETLFARVDAGADVDTDRYFLNCTLRTFQSYQQMARHSLPVVLARNRQQGSTAADHGMIDIFNAERLFPACGAILRADHVCGDLQRALGNSWRLDRQHLYLNRGIGHTRPWHIDAAGSPCIKLFVYLTEVLEIDDGPFGYVLGSHRLCPCQLHGVTPTDDGNYTVNLEDERTVITLAQRGDAVLAFVRGVHRGLPQAPRHWRIAVVGTFYPR